LSILQVKKKNETFIEVKCSPGIAYELRDHFSFMTPGARFDPRVQNKYWDGRKRLFNITNGTLFSGLLIELIRFCESCDYKIAIDPELYPSDIPKFEYAKFLDHLNIPNNFEKRDYQEKAFFHSIENDRALLLCPTASGKSLIIYLLCQYYRMMHKLRTLIVVDSLSLIHQMYDDLRDYGFQKEINRIYAGQEKETRAPITISTWQSLVDMPKKWYNQFGVIIGDEAHKFKAKSLVEIMKNAENIRYRFGTTGTLDEVECHEMQLVGLFGPVFEVITTKELINRGTLANLKINCVDLQYQKEAKIYATKNFYKNYHDEVDFIVTREKRNEFLLQLCESLNGNKLVLFQFVDKHGKVLKDLFEKHATQPTFFISGEVDGIERNEIRKTVNNNRGNSTLLATYGTTQTGINIVNINHVILASPSKSKIRVLQSIGRGLRKGEIKHEIMVWDIIDNLKYGDYTNHALLHFYNRLEIYNKEQFEYNIRHVKIRMDLP